MPSLQQLPPATKPMHAQPSLSTGSSSPDKPGTRSATAPGRSHLLIDGVSWTGIQDVDAMPPFFTTLVGDNDAWLFAGSNGGLCAGRRDPEFAVFPYVTVDRILDQPRGAGMLSVFQLELPGVAPRLWEPWSEAPSKHPRRRSLFKHPEGNGLCFEETDLESGLVFRCLLATCAPFGITRECRLLNTGATGLRLRCLDGWHRIIPPGIGTEIWTKFSYLAQAYMRHDRVPCLPMGIYTLNAAITDRAEPIEVQRAATAWSVGQPKEAQVLLSTRQVADFLQGRELVDETEIRGETGAFLLEFPLQLDPGASFHWQGCIDTQLDHSALLRLRSRLAAPASLAMDLTVAIARDRAGLRQRLASADGLCLSADSTGDEHHLSNTLFNIMRGGLPPAMLLVERDSFLDWLAVRNRRVAESHRIAIAQWPASIRMDLLPRLASATGDTQLERLAGLYLPLSFSRRHGDPSRPWNRFSIRLTNAQGRPLSAWQGNWRDIFQNWEALSLSFPTALPGMLSSFLDASSADGYNPYRITSEGVDWEVPEPHNPWAHLGYWGDHQIVYLQRLLSLAEAHFPGWLASRLPRRLHVCVDIPYRIAGLEATLRNPRDTVHFSPELHKAALALEHTLGTDGRLLQDGDKGPLLFSLAEKLLVPVLAKLSNLVPGGGIWLNTQRPEWNDANNALVGYGLSIVTVCQLRRHAALLLRLFDSPESFPCSPATASFLRAIAELLSKEVGISAWSDERRFEVLCSLGRAGEAHRTSVYAGKPGSFLPVPLSEVHHLLQAAIAVLDATILSSRRDDGLYHSYNLLELDGGRAGIARLQLMLEGQVAALSSGCLTGAQALELLRRLRQSELYRADQNSYVLYPDRKLPPFLERNRLDQEEASRSPLIRKLVAHSHRGILAADHEGGLHFAPDLGNSRDLEAALDQLAADPAFEALLPEGRKALLRLWESSFHHRSFLGRSGTMFAFEGLGSIYWHMVSKLLLSVQEARETAGKAGAPDTLLAELADAYYDIRSGLGPAKTPACFGAFTTDPYSHTPRHKGAQQPGMTGQVKEELLARRGELGVRIHDACIHFNPTLLRRSEFLGSPGVFRYVSLEGAEKRIDLPADSLAFTVCQVPVVYSLGGSPGHTLHLCDDSRRTIKGLSLDGSSSTSLFSRDGAIRRIDVQLGQNPSLLSP